MLVFAILCSPDPTIDVWVYLQIAAERIQQGINPYSLDFPAVYAGKPPAAFPYSPVTLLYLTPFHATFGDVRYGLVFAIFLAGILCFSQSNDGSKKYLHISLLALFPSTLNVIEQSWIDPVSLIPLAMAIRGLQKRQNYWFVAGLLLLPAVKHYNLAFLPFFLMQHPSYRHWKKAISIFLASIFAFIFQFLLFTPKTKSTQIFLKEMLFPTFDLTEIRHFSISDWLLAHQIDITANQGILFSMLLLGFSVGAYVWKFRSLPKQPAFWGSYSLMLFFLFYPNTALNYVWFAFLAWWMSELLDDERSEAPTIQSYDSIDIFYAISRIFIVIGLEPYISDVGLYFKYFSEWKFNGLIPYRDFPFEYPPIAWISMIFPANLITIDANSFYSYRFCFISALLFVDHLIFRFIKRNTDSISTYAYFTSILAMAHLTFDRIDLVLGLLLILPFFRFAENNRYFLKDWIIGLGGLYKIVPMILSGLPELTHRGGFRRAAIGAFISLSVFALGIIWMIQISDGRPTLLTYHSLRGIQIESLFGNWGLIISAISNESIISIGNNYGAQHLSGLPESVVSCGKVLSTFSVLATFSWIVFQKVLKREVEFCHASFLMILTFVTFSTVLSPQFILWLIPIGIYSCFRAKRTFDLYLLIAIAVTTGIHFHYYWSYVQKEVPFLMLLALRNMLLICLWYLTFSRVHQKRERSITR